MSTDALQQTFAMLFAIVIVFGMHVQDADLQPLLGVFDQRSFTNYTPYFPGFDNLDRHEIFAPENLHKKKVVFMGASSVDAIGCDYTWHRPAPGQAPNVHYTCSLAGQFNSLLKRAHLDDWKAFNLARNGSKLTDGLYIYARILALQPEIVIYGDSFNYYMWENADANAISAARYAFMDEIFSRYPETAARWLAYKVNLQKHGWIAANAEPDPPISLDPQPRARTSLRDLTVRSLELLRSRLPVSGPPRPTALNPTYRSWAKPDYTPHSFANPDPDLGYFQGFRLIADMQKRIGKKFAFFFCPQWEHDSDIEYQNGLSDVFGAYLKQDNIPFASYVSMKMAPIDETYDGYHHTVQGNHKIAKAIFRDLEHDGFLP
jgi:hypothetical protein